MFKRRITMVLVLMFSLPLAFGQSNIPDDIKLTNYKLLVTIKRFKLADPTDDQKDIEFVAGEGSKLYILRLVGDMVQFYFRSVKKPNLPTADFVGMSFKTLDPQAYSAVYKGDKPTLAQPRIMYQIKSEDFQEYVHYLPDTKFVHGVLSVPFKYKNDQFDGKGTIGFYGGYGWFKKRISTSFIASAGLTTMDEMTQMEVTDDNGTPGDTTDDTTMMVMETEEDKAAFTAATGVLFDFRNQFQIGLIYGWDKAESSEDWWSFAIGYKFSQ